MRDQIEGRYVGRYSGGFGENSSRFSGFYHFRLS